MEDTKPAVIVDENLALKVGDKVVLDIRLSPARAFDLAEQLMRMASRRILAEELGRRIRKRP